MKYQAIDTTRIIIEPEGMLAKEMLLAIARHSFNTALARGFGVLQDPTQQINLEECIQYEGDKPVMLIMDYVAGRDCRTKVYLGSDNRWYFDSYAFQQRRVSSDEFISGVVRDPADKFLEEVIKQHDITRKN